MMPSPSPSTGPTIPTAPTTPTTAVDSHRNLKLIPAALLKQLQATASLCCYDYLFLEESMKKQDLWRKAFHLFHGNEELNTISQVDLLMSGHGEYGRIYDSSEDFPVTDCLLNRLKFQICKKLVIAWLSRNCSTRAIALFVSFQVFTSPKILLHRPRNLRSKI